MRIHNKKRFIPILFITLLTTSFLGCDNSLDVTADWKEIPLIYGLLNPSAEYNYIRVNRAYLNQEGDAFKFASESDSIQFKDLTVSLVEFKNGVEENAITMNKVIGDTIGLEKEDGNFAKSPNILYRTSYPIKQSFLSTIYSYELVVVNNQSGKVYRSLANMVGESEIFSPIRESNQVINIDDDTLRFLYINYREGPQAKMYDCIMRFRYKEYAKGSPNEFVVDSVDWLIFKSRETLTLRGYKEQQTNIKSYLFYDFLRTSIGENSDVERVPLDMGFYLYGSGEDLFTYVEVNKPSIGIVQKKPEFTNISDGLGIFSSLNIKAFNHVTISDPMMNTLISSERVAGLNFVRP